MAALAFGALLVAAEPWSGTGESPIELRQKAPVDRRTILAEVVTRGASGYPHAGALLAGGAGRVTSVEVAASEVIEQDTPVLAIDGRTSIAVSGPMPFWRQLGRGMRGGDVKLLQRVLKKAGFGPGSVDGTFGASTEAALRRWQAAHGYAASDGVLRIDDMLVGAWPLRVGSVHVVSGSSLQPGAEILELTGQRPVLNVELIPSDRLRVDLGDPAVVEISATGETAPGKLTQVADAAVSDDTDGGLMYPGQVTLAEDARINEGAQAQVSIIVAEVEDALAVPLAAVISNQEGDPAVRVVGDDGTVTITAVELGPLRSSIRRGAVRPSRVRRGHRHRECDRVTSRPGDSRDGDPCPGRGRPSAAAAIDGRLGIGVAALMGAVTEVLEVAARSLRARPLRALLMSIGPLLGAGG